MIHSLFGGERFAIMASAAIVAVAAATPAKAQIRHFDVPAQEAARGVAAFGRQAEIQILISAADARTRQTNAVRGSFTVEQGLERLLAGTGLRARRTGPGTYAVGTGRQGIGDAAARPAPAGGSVATSSEMAERDIIVTGSRIARPDTRGPSPVTTIDRTAIDRSGATNINDTLRLATEVSSLNDESGQSSYMNATSVRLRGLPLGTTLVLINGRRVAPSGSNGQYFDLGNLPLEAVERVEILADSASAIYGADAIAGVVNIITRRRIDGVTVSGRVGTTTEGHHPEYRLSAAAGFGAGPLTSNFVIDYLDRSPLYGRDRAITANADYRPFGYLDLRSTASNPGNVYSLPGRGNLPGLNATFAAVPAGSTGIGLTPASFAATAGQLNRATLPAYQSLVPETRQLSLFNTNELALGDRLTLFSEFLYSHLEQNVDTQPIALTGGSSGSFTVPANNPFNPFGVPVGIDLALTGLGPVRRRTEQDFFRALAGVRGALFSSWNWEIAGSLSREAIDSYRTPVSDPAKVRAALNQTDPALAFNPFQDGPGGSPAVLASLVSRNDERYVTDYRAVDAQLSGPLFRLPAGSVQLLFGGELRHQRRFARSLMNGVQTSSVDNSRADRSLYAEALVPIISEEMGIPLFSRLSLSAALRRDWNEGFGSTTNPKIGVEWYPVPSLLLRGTYGTAFKAPNLIELFAPQSSFQFTGRDPRRGNQTVIVTATTGGRPDVLPEAGWSHTLGAVWQPRNLIPNLEVSIDYYRIRNDRRIVRAGTDTILANEGLFPGRVVRAQPTLADIALGYSGMITSIDATTANFGEIDVEGVDAKIRYSFTTSFGRFSTAINATRALRYDAAVTPGAAVQERLGLANFDGFAPKWKASASLDWSHGPVNVGLQTRYTGSYRDYTGPRTVSGQALFDISLSYDFRTARLGPLNGVRARLGVVNLFDADPPFVSRFLGYDPLQAEIRGRFVYFGLSGSFR